MPGPVPSFCRAMGARGQSILTRASWQRFGSCTRSLPPSMRGSVTKPHATAVSGASGLSPPQWPSAPSTDCTIVGEETMASLLGAKIQAGFGAALLILGALGAVSYWQAGHFREDAQWVAHTHAVLAKLATVLSQVADVETGQRGYLLTGVASFLEPYNAAVPALAQTLQELRALTADNPHQQGRLDALAPLLAEFTTAAAVTVAVRQTEGLEAAQWAVVMGQGKQRMEALRRLLGEMAEEERALLQKRAVQTATSARRTTWIIVLGSLAALGLVVTASLRLQRELAGRMQAEEALRQANDVLDQGVQERTSALASV